ncbi:MAG: 16S rRNA (guanine(966)-N(2))-methyltransferase RsmD [Myxococcota bacterium]
MRVIAGQFGGRRLSTAKHGRTRPTPDRVREALFSILGDLADTRVLDLFAGSGALGLEALSRGATHTTFVERDRAALAALRSNIEALGVGATARVLTGDAFKALDRMSGPFDLVFLDPPYAAEAWGKALGLLDSRALLSESARVVCEHGTGSKPALSDGWTVCDERAYGDVSIVMLRKA